MVVERRQERSGPSVCELAMNQVSAADKEKGD